MTKSKLKCKECMLSELNNPKHPICNYHQGYQEAKKEFFGKVKKILKQMKEDRQMHPVNINDWNDGYDDCLDIYIKELEELGK